MHLDPRNDHVDEARWSLQRRLVWSLFALLGLATVLQVWISYRTFLLEADRLFDYQMQQMAGALQNSRGVPRLGPAELEGDLEDFAFVVNIRDIKGRLLFSNGAIVLPDFASTGFANADTSSERYRIYTHAGARIRIQVGQELESRSELATELALHSLWPLLLFSLVILLLVFLVVARGFRPMTRLREQVAQRRPDDLQPLPNAGLPDEIRPLVTDFNALLTRMHEAYEVQRRFVSDAAHELRTPLTAVQLQCEAVRRAVTPDQRETALARQRDGIARATHLVEQLLSLARRDARGTPLNTEVVALSEIVAECLADHEDSSRQKRIGISIDLAGAASAMLPAEPMRSIMRNLLDNAIKYTPPAGCVQISAHQDSSHLQVYVDDSGSGIPVAERQRVTDRFYRIPGNQAYGSGLGLAIVVEALATLDGRLELRESTKLGGLQAACHIPI